MLGLLFKLPAIATAIVITALVVLYFTVGRQVTGTSLGHSINAAAESEAKSSECSYRAPVWRCAVTNPGGGVTRYTVRADGHCWRARRTAGGRQSPARLHGCVGVLDQLRLFG